MSHSLLVLGSTARMKIALPPSLQKELHSLESEVAWARTLTPEQRLVVTHQLCRDAIRQLAMNPKRDRILELRDPVPDSTVRALARLRSAT